MAKRGVLTLSAALLMACSGPNAKKSLSRSASDFVWDRPVLMSANLPITRSATCRFKHGLAVSFQKDPASQAQNPPERISYSEFSEDEANTVSFVDLDTGTPKVQSNGGQATLKVVNDSGQIITLLNHPEGSVAAELYTLFKNTGVVVYSQQKNSVFIGPFGVLEEMGYCN